ncbi:MAG: hypothetical protein KQJ78_24055 [Deltaproteobacteria bacterium]|nr:hypothetical protein [Deltaproteobacteria bacterium]
MQKEVIKKVSENGTVVILMSGAEYKVLEYTDQDVAYNWLPGQEVKLRDSGREMYNVNSGERVGVKQTKAPEAPSTADAAAASGAAPPREGSSSAGSFSYSNKSGEPSVEARLRTLERKLEDVNVKLKVMELKMMRLERMAGVSP